MDYLKIQKGGICYESGITVKEARKTLADTLKDRNLPGTKPEDMILTTDIIDNTVTRLDACFLMRRRSLKTITIPNSVTAFGVAMFNGCTSLENITLPKTMTTFGNSVFNECKSLKRQNAGERDDHR